MYVRKIAMGLCCLASCLFATAKKNIIIETDMGNDVEDVVALDMLYKLDDKKEVNLMAIMLNKMGDYPLQYVDLLNTWYGHKKVPIGTIGADNADIWAKPNFTKTVVEMKGEDGKPLYKRTVKDISKLPPRPRTLPQAPGQGKGQVRNDRVCRFLHQLAVAPQYPRRQALPLVRP